MKRKFFKSTISLIFVFALLFILGAEVLAEEADKFEDGSESIAEIPENNAPVPEETTFKEVYDLVAENSGKILSLLSFIGTLFIALIYKKALLPGLKKVTASVTDALGAIKEETEKTELSATECQTELKSLSKATEKLCSNIEELESCLCPEKAEKQRQTLYTLISGQIDLLYDIFMSSSLPEYKKEDVGCRIAKMKEVLMNETLTE